MHESGDNSSGRKEGKDQNMKRILIFSGTTEGRRITEFLDGRNVKVYVSAATEYGKECTGEHEEGLRNLRCAVSALPAGGDGSSAG